MVLTRCWKLGRVRSLSPRKVYSGSVNKLSMSLNRTAMFCALLLITGSLLGQQPRVIAQAPDDGDHDGLPDKLEQQLLVQFAPKFMIGKDDCSVRPAEFRLGQILPQVAAENGTIYGQVFPTGGTRSKGTFAEVHYYHLWRTDCGRHGHALDPEHAAVLIRASGEQLLSASWKAVY